MAENAAGKQPRRGPGRPFPPGRSGNPAGKPRGARHRATILAEQLLDGEAETIVRTIIEKAKQGDMIALRLCLDRIIPPRHDRPLRFRLPAMRNASDAAIAMAAITEAVADARVTASEAAELSKLVESFVGALEATEFDQRLKALEENDRLQKL